MSTKMARIMCQRYCSEGISKWSTSSDEEKESSKYRSYYPGTLADLCLADNSFHLIFLYLLSARLYPSDVTTLYKGFTIIGSSMANW
jgi:hypothetical protein